MARTGERGQTAGVVEMAHTPPSELATLGMEKGLWKPEDLDWIFRTVARPCKDKRDQWLYLKKCQAMGLSPLKQELHAIEREVRPRNGTPFKVVTFVVSYYVYVSRSLQRGYILRGQDVRSKDDFAWDAAEGKPLRHVINPLSDRGKVVGAWANAMQEKTGRIGTGSFWPYEELVSNSPNPLREKMPGHFAWKTALCRIGRIVAPDLQSVYAAEEMGYALLNPGDPTAPPEGLVDASVPHHEQLDAQGAHGGEPPKIKPLEEGAVIDADFESDPDPSPGAAIGAAAAEARLPFKERAGIQRDLAQKCGIFGNAVVPFLSEALGRKIGSTDELSQGDLGRVREAMAKHEKEKG